MGRRIEWEDIGFKAFFARQDTFALGIGNGYQFMAALSPIIPGAKAWPKFTRNKGEECEARASHRAVCGSPRSPGGNLSAQPERQARRPLHRADAATRTHDPQHTDTISQR